MTDSTNNGLEPTAQPAPQETLVLTHFDNDPVAFRNLVKAVRARFDEGDILAAQFQVKAVQHSRVLADLGRAVQKTDPVSKRKVNVGALEELGLRLVSAGGTNRDDLQPNKGGALTHDASVYTFELEAA